MKPPFYISTPIYYTSGNLHIGHSYSTVAADAMARYKRARGYDVFFLTGTDEHGQKIQERAAQAGKEPKQFVDDLVAGIKDLWKLFNISYDGFIRTTDEDHERRVQYIIQKLYDQGDIYRSKYKGLYCTPCEAYWTESQLVDGHCPDCGREVKETEEECYFFRLSKYTDRLIKLFEEHPEFVQPESRANEMLNNFLRPGLQDLAVTRSNFDWGVRVPFDPEHVVYVWIDALSNYITALGYPDQKAAYDKFWPCDVHLVGKEIVRFHTIIWPALLMALDLPLPKQVYGHGWILFKEGKMSKSKGNVVDPVVLCDRYQVDAMRYFLLREVPFGADGSYSNEALIQRINADLVNDLGNLLSRTTAMIAQFFGGVLPQNQVAGPEDEKIEQAAQALVDQYYAHMDAMQFNLALTDLWKLISLANKYIDETAPWLLAKDENSHPRLARVLRNLGEVLRLVTSYLSPFMPETAEKMRAILHLEGEASLAEEELRAWGRFAPTAALAACAPLFPRLKMDVELAYLDSLLPDQEESGVKVEKATKDKKDKQRARAETKVREDSTAQPEGVAYIEFTDFTKVEMKVGRIVACERVEGADKLLKETVDMGDHQRTIVSGIAPWYQPEELIGKYVVAVTNLQPRKLRGVLSEGMLLAADTEDGGCRLLTVDGEVKPGSQVG